MGRIIVRQQQADVDGKYILTDMDTAAQAAFNVGATSSMLPTNNGSCKLKAPTGRWFMLDTMMRLETPDGVLIAVGYKGDYLVEHEGKSLMIMRKDDFESRYDKI